MGQLERNHLKSRSFSIFLLAFSTLYLSWSQDPTTTMTVQWHTPLEDTAPLYLDLPNGTITYSGTSRPFSQEPITVHTVRLQDLDPDNEYSFHIGENGATYKFRTAPKTFEKPLKFIIGGDLYLSAPSFRKMGQVAMNQDPLFVVIGGDIAYTVNSPRIFASTPEKQWLSFLTSWTKCMQTADGRIVPFVLVPGNHDISPERSELFFTLFDFPEKKLYRAMDFGSALSLILLDTGHYSPIEGEQTMWLEKSLSARARWPYLFAIYHVGAYPSFYSYDTSRPAMIRKLWCPLFDAHGVQGAFEHHSHTYKKTFPLKANRKDTSGTYYFGDGCWGVKPRKPHKAWYLDKIGSKNHIHLIEMGKMSVSIQAIGINGELLDETTIPSKN